MTHPSYLLNPGDMFQVDRESVLYATGRQKGRQTQDATTGSTPSKAEEESNEAEEEAAEEAADEAGEEAGETEAEAGESVDPERATKQLKFLSRLAKKVIAEEKNNLKVKKKRDLRTFIKEARVAMSKLGRSDAQEAINTDLLASVNDMLKDLAIQDPNAAAKAEESGGFSAEATAEAKMAAEAARETKEGSTPAQQEKKKQREWHLSEEELARMKAEIDDFEDNPYDPSKRYATPWQPRPYMSAFAFIPRYLEVNQNICAAVYLRHPVARRNFAEVPSPFPPQVMQLAFNWYLRRR